MPSLYHRAVFGEKNGAHALLYTSVPDPLDAASVTNLTDLPPDWPSGKNWEPFTRGFLHGHWYVIARTFPDPDASRPGMVKTCALLIDAEHYVNVENLAGLFALLPEAAIDDWATSPTDLPPIFLPETGAHPKSIGFASVIRALLHETKTSRPVIWVGQDGFEDAVAAVWGALWPSARRTFHFGFLFSPNGVDRTGLKLVAIPGDLVSRWHGFTLVRGTDPEPIPLTSAEAFLLGQPEGAPIRDLLRQLETELPGLADLASAGLCSDYLSRFEKASPSELRALLQHIVSLAPVPKNGSKLKRKVLSQLVEISGDGDAEDILGLRILEKLPLDAGSEECRRATERWFQAHLDNDSEATFSVVSAAFRDPNRPWSQSIFNILRQLWGSFSKQFAGVLWAWWQRETSWVGGLGKYLPRNCLVEMALVETCPANLEGTVGTEMRRFASDRRLFQLHAAVAIASMPPANAFAAQIEVDSDPSSMDGLRLIYTRVPVAMGFQVALNGSEERLYRIAGEHSSAKQMLVPAQPCLRAWQRILSYALSNNSTILQSLPDLRKLVHSLLDGLLNGQGVDENLLRAIGKRAEASLVDYPHRREIWARLPHTVAGLFAEATADDWISRFLKKPGFEKTLERDLERLVFCPPRIHRLLAFSEKHAIEVGLSLFTNFGTLHESNVRAWFLAMVKAGVPLRPEQAAELGSLLLNKQWRLAAGDLADELKTFPHIAPALRQCLPLFGFLRQLTLSWSLGEEQVEPESFWRAFLEIAPELYPKGPTDRKLWSRAGGDAAALESEGRGRNLWRSALELLRQGGDKNISASSLIAEMRQEYPKNTQLEPLAVSAKKLHQ